MRKPWFRRPSRIIPLALLVAALIVGLVFIVSPWPAALLIRSLFEKGAAETVTEMLLYVPDKKLVEHTDVQYGDSGTDTTLDVFSAGQGPHTTVVWIHGGAWISGDKQNVDPYARILASSGYTVVSLNYTVAPEATYPTALTQLNEALAFLVTNASAYDIDPDSIVIAGDSAGANLTSQLATIITNPDYAQMVGLTPALSGEQLRAVILNCGIYDVSGIPNAPGIGGWGFRIALWSYLGTKDWSNTPDGDEMSTLDFVTASFPRTWISGGNGDPLTATQSKPLAAKLKKLGVDVTAVFYPEDNEPALPHEYQFHLDYAEAQNALDSTLAFLASVDAEARP